MFKSPPVAEPPAVPVREEPTDPYPPPPVKVFAPSDHTEFPPLLPVRVELPVPFAPIVIVAVEIEETSIYFLTYPPAEPVVAYELDDRLLLPPAPAP